MTAKVVVFPIRGRNWCFTRSVDPSMVAAQSSNTPSTFKELWNRISSSSANSKGSSEESKATVDYAANVELTVDFAANKMNRAWSNLEKAPEGTFKNKIHGVGLKLLSRVKPSEIFFKSIPKEINRVDIVYPSSLNPRLVRRRLRHIAYRGSVIHKKYFYGSAILLPLTSVFMVLPLPNIPFFWILFRTYSHWRASQGSEKLLNLVSDGSYGPNSSDQTAIGEETSDKNSENFTSPPWVRIFNFEEYKECEALQPSEELEKLLHQKDGDDALSECAISKICQKLYLNPADVRKYRDSI